MNGAPIARMLKRIPLLDVLPLLIPLSLFAPMAWHRDAFSFDWANHLFLVASMEDSIRQLGHPSYFIHSDELGLYDPIFAFYGGTLYALTGFLGIVMGSPVRAYVTSYGLGFAMTYGGMYWVARLTGLRSLLAHVPAVVTVTGAYYLTDVYARGAWPEFLAVSAIPLVIAGVADLLYSGHPRVRSMLAVYGAVVVFTGSHNITLVWGTIVLIAVGVVGALAVGMPAVARSFRRLELIGLVVLLAGGTNFWFLLPDVAYAGQTGIARAPFFGYLEFDKASVLFSPWHVSPVSAAPQLYVQVSVYVLAWSLIVLSVAAKAHLGTRVATVFAGGLVAVGAGLLLLTISDESWDYMSPALRLIQFPYRLQSYVLLITAGISLLAVHAAQRLSHRRLALGALAIAVAVQVGLAEWQVWGAPRYFPGSVATAYAGSGHTPPTWYGSADYRVASGRRVTPSATLALKAEFVRDDRIAVAMPQAPGDYGTNVVASPFVRASGAAVDVGYSPLVNLVVRRSGDEPKGALLTLEPRRPTAQRIGLAVSVISPLLMGVLATATWWRTLRLRRLQDPDTE